VKISPKTENATIESFSIGFPRKYRANLCFSMAFNTENFDEQLVVDLDRGLNVTGYYGATVTFPIDVSDLLYNGQPYTFTVLFVFSDLIQSAKDQIFTLDFPVYPSLAYEVSTCNVGIILPENTNYTDSDFPFNVARDTESYHLNYTQNNLPQFTRMSTQISFALGDKNDFVCFSVREQNREITINEDGQISLYESFVLESRTAFTIDKIKLQLFNDARSVYAYDGQGKELITNASNKLEVPLSLVANQSKSVEVVYKIDRENHLIQQDAQNYVLTLNLSENSQLMPQIFNLKIIFPEGAVAQSFPEQKFSIHRDVFQDTLSITFFNLTWLQNEQWDFTYSYTAFWASFRPTLWVITLVIVGSIVAFAWQRPKAPILVSVVLVPRETLNDFVEIFEERKKVYSELEQMKRKARKGKISRRRYKVRKTTLENRISALSKKLSELQQKIMSGGAKYADIMRQLEVAETELDNIEADIMRIEVRFKRGEISAQTYRRLLEEDYRRREKTTTTIDGLLLRLRE